MEEALARRALDAAAFLVEAGLAEAAASMEQQALLNGQAQYHAAHGRYGEVADLIDRLAEVEERFVAALHAK